MAFGFENELRAEIARLRDALDEQTGRAAWHYECLTQCEERVIQRDAEIARLRLTDAEREALWTAAEAYAENDGDPECERIATALHALWQRTKGGAPSAAGADEVTQNTQDQRLATADETTPADGIASPLHPLVRWRKKEDAL
jgi:hypothetical protein